MKVTLIEFGKKNENGRTYLYHEVSELPDVVPCTLDSANGPVNRATIGGPETVGLAKLSMDQDGIYADVNPFYSDYRGRMFEELMMLGAKIVPSGTGSVNANGEVSDYRMQFVFLTTNPL
jgi:hypothetical protein